MLTPCKLLDALNEHVPGFDREHKQFAVAMMLWATIHPRHQHRKYQGAASFSRAQLRRMFGSDEKFRQINRYPLARYFHVLWSQNSDAMKWANYTNGYIPTMPLQDALGDFLLKGGGSDLVNEKGLIVRTVKAAVDSLDMNGNQVVGWERNVAPNLVPIDLDAVKRLAEHYMLLIAAHFFDHGPVATTNDGFTTTVLRARQTLAVVAAASSVRFYGSVPHRYVQAMSGRLFAEDVNLQNYSRVIRNVALAGMYDYDISCCHFAITYQLAATYSFPCSAIRTYVLNKQIIRQQLATEVGITVKQAKSVLTMTAYGAEELAWDEGAIVKEIGKEAAFRLYANPIYRAIKEELVAATRIIITHARKVRGKFCNLFGRLLLDDDASDASIMAHLLQGIEAVALRAAIRTCSQYVVLLVHDGFITSQPVNLDAIHNAVKETTGMHLTFECEEITSPLIDMERELTAAHIKTIDLSDSSIHAALRRVLGGGHVTVVGDRKDLEIYQVPPVWPDPIPDGMFNVAF